MGHSLINERSAKPLMILAMAIFGTVGLMTHYINLPSTVIVLIRGSVGVASMLLLIILMRYRLNRSHIRRNLKVLLASGVCLGLNWIFLFEAYKTIDVSIATLCNYLTPAFVILVSPIFLKESLTFRKVVCVAVALFGMVLVSGVLQKGSIDQTELIGIGAGILGAVFYTGMIIFNKKLDDIRPYDMTIVQLAVGTSVVILYALFSVDFGCIVFDSSSIILSVVMGVVQTAIAFTLYFGSLHFLDAQTAAVYGYVEPILSLFLAAVVLGESLGTVGWIGAVLVLGSTLAYELIAGRPSKKGSS